ncbi:hypothetical protein G7Y89_g12205 [Cudoniella acicularis]|uniref:Uncharacterized protein n=1 Tax=Cudoniella acicularis TaxID=354080 RepID=A0A8H4RBZ6_9HELO|nr:hypothetical protein G7Y89_g12205 [Cudoniella acicularis]
MKLQRNLVIDATRGDIARSVNHSYMPNYTVGIWQMLGLPRMGIFTGGEGIKASMEITIDYEFEPLSHEDLFELPFHVDSLVRNIVVTIDLEHIHDSHGFSPEAAEIEGNSKGSGKGKGKGQHEKVELMQIQISEWTREISEKVTDEDLYWESQLWSY